MSNPIPKLQNTDHHTNQSANQTAKNSSGATAQLNISAVQSREIFGQVNINLKLNTRNSAHEKENPRRTKKNLKSKNELDRKFNREKVRPNESKITMVEAKKQTVRLTVTNPKRLMRIMLENRIIKTRV